MQILTDDLQLVEVKCTECVYFDICPSQEFEYEEDFTCNNFNPDSEYDVIPF